MKSIDQKLIENKYRQQRKGYLEKELAQINERLEREIQTCERLKKALDKENDDVSKLTQVSLSRLFSTFSGRGELQWEKEKAEAFRAALDYKLKQNDLEELRYQKNLLEQELSAYEAVNSEYQTLLDLKRKMLETPLLNQIRSWEQDLAVQAARKKKIQEAWDSGKKLCASFSYLFDMVAEMLEDPTVRDEVTKEMMKVNDLWAQFHRELKDAEIAIPADFDQAFALDLSGVSLHQDVQSIHRFNALFEQLNRCYSQVRTLLNQMEKQLSEMAHQHFDLQRRIQASIEMN